MSGTKKTLKEAAAEIFTSQMMAKRSEGDKFGLGQTLHPGGPKVIELGPEHDNASQPFVNFTSGVPTATPPGHTPPVGPEPKKVLPTQPQQNQGFGSNKNDNDGPIRNMQAIAAREVTGWDGKAITPGQGNVLPTWGNKAESVILSPEDLEAFLDEAKKAGCMDDDDGKKKTFVASWKDERKKNIRAKDKAERKSVKEEIASVVDYKAGISDDVAAILSGETLTDEFKDKATTIFEAAVITRVNEVSEVLETLFDTNLTEAVEAIKVELEEKVDNYLSYMVEEWVKENEIAIEKGLRGEIVDDFITGLRNLFVEHYIDIPEEKVDLVTELSEKVAELEDKLNKELEKSVSMHKQIGEAKKIDIVNKICEGLTKTQVDKICSLAESVDFTSSEEFAQKVTSIKESYFPQRIIVPNRDSLNNNQLIVEDTSKINTVSDPMMREVVTQLSRMAIK